MNKYICQACRSSLTRTARSSPQSTPISRSTTYKLSHVPHRNFSVQCRNYKQKNANIAVKAAKQDEQSNQFWGNDVTMFSADNSVLVTKAQALGNQILNDATVPSEEEVQKTLDLIKVAALQLNAARNIKNKGKKMSSTPSLSLEGTNTSAVKPGSTENTAFLSEIQFRPSSSIVSLSIATKLLSTLAYRIIKHPPVFLSAKVLEAYVEIQTSLGQMATLPEVFDLYAHKPAPEPNSSPIKYIDPNPKKASQAVPETLANQAIDAAIAAKDLTLSLDIISATFAAPAYRRNKFVRKALPLLSVIGLVPATALPLAQQWATTSYAADPTELMIYTFMGIMTYAGSVFSLGYIALTTHNDQMERVSWMPGTPLKQRWMREEERAAADRVALAWGFKQLERRGEEEGEEWNLLREWCGLRGMFLDATELMEGME